MLHIDQRHVRGTINRMIDVLRKSYMTTIGNLDLTAWITKEPVPFEKRYEGVKKHLTVGDTWGELWDCGWFQLTGKVPHEGAGKKIVLLIDINGEGNIYDENLCPIRGITNVSSTFERSLGEPTKRVFHLLEKAEGNEDIDLWMETGCNDLFGNYCKDSRIEEAHIAIYDEEMRSLYYDFEVLRNLMDVLDKDSARYHKLFRCLREATYALNPLDEEGIKKARAILQKELDKKGGDPSLSVSAIGHAHIDLAWLWPIRETKRKGARTFSTVMDLMDRYPDYVFGASQPQLFQWMKEGYPALYEKIKAKIDEGRMEVQGGMWVESDTNVPSGESLVRQLLYGKAYFREEFGKDMKVLWLPDVFGYSGALPQILKKSGIDYFMTIKLSWSEVNPFPHHTFNWEGIDGTSVLAHMPPEGTYNSSATPKAVKAAGKNYRDKTVSDECLLLYGIGDGGGGPGAEHLERLKRMKNLDGISPVKQEPAIDFFHRLDRYREDYATWNGELYLEKHQGTYTTSSKSKWFNRKMEIALGQLEYLSTLASRLGKIAYPKERLETIWKEILLYQFHDILPGSSIKRVYDESIERYEVLYGEVQQMIENMLAQMVEDMDTSSYAKPYMITNTTSYERREWVQIDGKATLVTVPPYGYVMMDAHEGQEHTLETSGNQQIMENDCLRILFGEDGRIQSIYHKGREEEVLAGIGNALTLYHDQGNAWDFSMDYKQMVDQSLIPEQTEVKVSGHETIATQIYRFGESTMTQKIILTEGSSRLDFQTDLSWYEANKMIRVAFPTRIQAHEATCDIQFGHIKRSNHNNTSWDGAQFEICAQKWVDLSDASRGVALLNDSKYGYAVEEGTLDLDLIRSTNYPGKGIDQGEHRFTYSLYVHEGNVVTGQVNKEAYALNEPLLVTPCKKTTGTGAQEASYFHINHASIVIESVKRAEQGKGTIVRLYESAGGVATGNLIANLPYKRVREVNLIEDSIGEELQVVAEGIPLTFKPFEIRTILLED